MGLVSSGENLHRVRKMGLSMHEQERKKEKEQNFPFGRLLVVLLQPTSIGSEQLL